MQWLLYHENEKVRTAKEEGALLLKRHINMEN
jgi:hypothetical protein